MKLIVERDALLGAVDCAARVADPSAKIPVLAHALIDATKKGARIAAHALDYCVEVTLPADVQAAGAAVVPAAQWLGLVKQSPEGSQIELTVDGGRLRMKAGRGRYTLPVLPAADFPDLLALAGEVAEFSLNGADVTQCFARTAFSIGDNISQLYTRGVYLSFEKKGEKFAAIATSGLQLCRVDLATPAGAEKLPHDESADKRQGVLVPSDTMREIVRLSGGAGVMLRVARNALEVRRGNVRYLTKLIDCIYPPYEALLERSPPTGGGFIASRDDLRAAFARLRVIAEKDQKKRGFSAGFSWDEGGNSVRIQLATSVASEGEEEIAAETTGSMDRLGIPVLQFSSMLDAIEGERVQVNSSDKTVPVRVSDPDDDRLTLLQVPSWA